LFHHSYLITLRSYLCSQWTPNVEIKYFIFHWSIYRPFLLNWGWKIAYLQIIIFVYVCSSWGIVVLKTWFNTWKARNDANGVNLFHLSYLITLMAYLCWQWTPNVQIKYFMFDWLSYRSFVLNTAWKRDCLQMMIFVNVCSTWGMVEIKTRFETWMRRNNVSGISLFHHSYLITLMAYLCS
jgi:hypothetical protein